jgi:predicted aspartyl protease
LLPAAVTVPLEVVGNRAFVTLTLALPGGPRRKARFLVDTGGGGFLLAEPLARELGITWEETVREEGTEFGRAAVVPQACVSDFTLKLDPTRVLVILGKENILPPVAPGHAEGLLPGHILAQYHVVFDYPRQTFTIGLPGIVTPEGAWLPMPVSKRSGFPRTELAIERVPHGFLIDTGASFTMVSEVVLKRWGEEHPEWERHEGAVGDAVILGGRTLETMIVGSAAWGMFELRDVGVVSQPKGTFEQWMSSMMSAPIIGALAGNVLKRFRLELDYVNQALYLSE